jgi:hypothetical protein
MKERKSTTEFSIILYPLSNAAKIMYALFEETGGCFQSRLKWKVTGMLTNKLT